MIIMVNLEHFPTRIFGNFPLPDSKMKQLTQQLLARDDFGQIPPDTKAQAVS
ncbi:MAG: hypothetical protein ACI8UO_006343 [Verrucomicrobiales bacterium]|jgi:hypothetical protein